MGNSYKKKSMKRMFFSGHRVTEIRTEDDVEGNSNAVLDQSLSSESSSA